MQDHLTRVQCGPYHLAMTSLSEYQKLADLDQLAREAIAHEGPDAYAGATVAQLAAAFAAYPDLWIISYAKVVDHVDGWVTEVPAQPGDVGVFCSDFAVSEEFRDALRAGLANGSLG